MNEKKVEIEKIIFQYEKNQQTFNDVDDDELTSELHIERHAKKI